MSNPLSVGAEACEHSGSGGLGRPLWAVGRRGGGGLGGGNGRRALHRSNYNNSLTMLQIYMELLWRIRHPRWSARACEWEQEAAKRRPKHGLEAKTKARTFLHQTPSTPREPLVLRERSKCGRSR